MLGPQWENWLLFENSAQLCGVLDKIYTFGIQTGMYGIYINNWTKFQLGLLREIYGDGAMKSCSVRESKIITQFLQPFNPCQGFVSSFGRQRFSLTCIS